MSDKETRRKQALEDAETRGRRNRLTDRIDRSKTVAKDKAPDVEGQGTPPFEAAVIARLEEISARLERIEQELDIEQ